MSDVLTPVEPAPGTVLGDRTAGLVAATSVRANHVAAVLVLGLLVAAPLLLIDLPLGSAARHGDGVVVGMAWTIVLYSAVRIAVFCWRALPWWGDVLFWADPHVWIGLAGLAQTATAINPMSTPLDTSVATTQFSMILVGLVAFELGRLVRTRWPRPTAGPARKGRVLSRGRVIALSVLSLVATPPFVVALGGIRVLFSSRQALTESLTDSALYSSASTASGGTLVAVSNVLPFASALCILCLWRAHRELRRDVVLIGLFAALLVSNALLNNPFSNPRYWFFAAAIAALLSLRAMERPAARIALVVFYLVAATVLFPYSNYFRTTAGGTGAATQSTDRPVDYLIGSTDYGSVTDVGITVKYVDHNGHTEGNQLLGALGFWVPRSWWPDKATNTYELLASEANFPNRNLDTPLWAEGFIDFGYVGTAGLLALFGYLTRSADAALERASVDPRRHAHIWFPIAVSFVGYESFLLRGSLLQAMAKIVLLLGIIALLATRSADSKLETT